MPNDVKQQFDRLIDNLMFNLREFNCKQFLEVQEPNRKTAIELSDSITGYQEEFASVIKGSDPDLIEAYEKWNAKDLKLVYDNLCSTQECLQHYINVEKKITRRRKKKPFEHKLKHFRYCPKYDVGGLRLESIDPTLIEKAKSIWVYDTVYKQLIQIVVESQKSFDIHRMKVLNYDTTKTVKRRVKKPELAFSELNTMTHASLLRMFNSQKTKIGPHNGRINDNMVIVAVQ